MSDENGLLVTSFSRPSRVVALHRRAVTRDIETEFRRIDKFIVRTNPVEQVVVTDNWIVFVGRSPWKFHVAHQSDVSVNLLTSEYHQISGEGQVGGTQYLHIEVVNRKPATESFKFRQVLPVSGIGCCDVISFRTRWTHVPPNSLLG